MNLTIFGLIAVIGLFTSPLVMTTSFSEKPSDDTGSVYLLKTHDQGLKNLFGVRHNFDDGFTTFLNTHQVTALERAGIGIEKISVYELTKPPGACEPWPTCKNNGGDDGGDGVDNTRTQTPTTQIPWGIATMYKNSGDTPSGGTGINVAVLDTGVNQDHFDLKNRIAECKDFTKGPSPKNTCKDDNGHGTHVAGTILADGGSDNLGIYGVAPDANLMAYKVCGSICWGDDIEAAIDYAGSHGVHIVSMSLGADAESDRIRDAISRNSHVLFVAAAGNDGPELGSIDYPGANANVVAVGAIDIGLNVASFSSRGVNDGDYVIEIDEVEFGAPGVNVYSAWNNGGYNTISGTSMATPHVSGLAAKFWQGNAEDTRTYLHSLALDIAAAGDDPATGFGLPQVP